MIFTIALLAGVAVGAAKSSASFQISSEVLASAGNSSTSSSFKSPANVVGQSATGTTSSTNFTNKSGYVPTIALADSINITFPTAGLLLARNNIHTITWTTTGDTGPTVNIFLLSPTGIELTALGVANTGSHGLFFPTSMQPGTDYIVLIVSTANSAINDTSDSFQVLAGNASVKMLWQELQ